ncbi:o-succinylbenzoate--CoA ligase [Haloactinomyces albus]|uniref:O-succinylbenzoic acid--CoA ligase n=1 Tax=Haloactinomyces albus TaxID=1352928 RepID=A0AAE4CNT2_9ACTN|nr:o-succinylbenzoate--CoA ligase [Haloactinomyces albus]MDR7302382.1 O-succinylbenzoic acid--CoA ligase [Haloactinomyces albus]
MADARKLHPLPVPAGARATEILPALRRALDGSGPALLPVPESEPTAGRHIAEALGADEPLGPGEDDSEDPTALVIATSGSTGTPKGVLLSISALRASATATHRFLRGAGHWLLAMPAQHIAGIQVLVRSLLAGTSPTAIDTTAGFRPDIFAEAFQRMPAGDGPRYTALVPTQLSRLLDDGDSHGNHSSDHSGDHSGAGAGLRALRAFDAVLLGGAATPPALLRRARDAGVRVVTTYGMSETAGGCVYDGTPLEGAAVHIGDRSDDSESSDSQSGDSESGVISLSGPMLARGYRRLPDTTAFTGGWFRTGDLGRWRDGLLEVLGRADDIIVTGGVNVAPGPVERVLSEHTTVREACVLGVDDPEWGQAVVAAVVPTDPSAPPPVDYLRAAVREHAGTAATPKRIAVLPRLPLRGPGKPDRQAIREALSG